MHRVAKPLVVTAVVLLTGALLLSAASLLQGPAARGSIRVSQMLWGDGPHHLQQAVRRAASLPCQMLWGD